MFPVSALFVACFIPNLMSVAAQTCGADVCGTTVVPFWRSFSSGAVDHFYTASTTEFINAANDFSYFPEGVATGVFDSQEGASSPLYRLNNVVLQDHFYTTNWTEVGEFNATGYTYEGIAAWVYTDAICGSHPLFRLFNPAEEDHFYTTSGPEVQVFLSQGYQSQGVAAFVPTAGIVTDDTVTCLGPGTVGLSST